ncbi:hypothetical protein CERSUDRAFT_76065 [Gelatoporia subvermispora B]|uniref:AIG1-type G domain-containing protein n=1 Tax=Ceriporiopsis subvermispora (strain B) TaxID=914234 RepID=M2QAC6_CERS8|nr:hypothetical protein CERSUDRAFT_76065 [Gelatoporia subvermispora B]
MVSLRAWILIDILRIPRWGLKKQFSSREQSIYGDTDITEVPMLSVMGPTGSGKSKVINTVTGSQFRVGTGLESCTGQVELATLDLDGQLVALVDTPGFDDSSRSQADIFKEISAFLRQSGIGQENFRMFRKICGSGAMENVAIVTNMWSEVKEEVGLERERELGPKPLFFKDAIDNGARMMRYHDSKKSGRRIIRSLLDTSPRTLQIQQETVDEQKSLPRTEAGTDLQKKLDGQLTKYGEELEEHGGERVALFHESTA